MNDRVDVFCTGAAIGLLISVGIILLCSVLERPSSSKETKHSQFMFGLKIGECRGKNVE